MNIHFALLPEVDGSSASIALCQGAVAIQER
jgi:hypothetical protein